MRNFSILFLIALTAISTACTQKKEPENLLAAPENFVLVKGGTFVNTKSNLHGKGATMNNFYIGKYEVSQQEWVAVMGSNPSKFKGDDLPVEMVSWYDCVEYCNKRSIKEGLEPYYTIDKDRADPVNKSEFDSVKWTVTINAEANGYRLPTEAEWEYAAGGGQLSKSYTFSGSNTIEDVAWFWQNSGDKMLAGSWAWINLENNHCKTKPVGGKKPNELGLYDMSGNVREWCEEWYEDFEIPRGVYRAQRGGGWMGSDYRCQSSNRDNFEASGKGPDQGFRLARSVN